MNGLWAMRRAYQHQRKIRRMSADILPRYTGRMVLMSIAAAVLMVAILAGIATAETTAIVNIANPDGALNVRSGAGMDYPVIAQVSWHDILTVDTVEDGWALVRYSGSEYRLGWVSVKYLAMHKK